MFRATVLVSFALLLVCEATAFSQETSGPSLPSIIRDQSPNASAGFLFRGYRSALRRSSDDQYALPTRHLTPDEAKRVAIYQSAVLVRLRGKQYDEAPLALLAGYELVRRGILRSDEMPAWVRDLGERFSEERRRSWRPVPGRAPDELGLALELLSKSKDWRVKAGAEAVNIALKFGLLDPLFPGGCVSQGYACTYTDQLQASGYTARSVETMVAIMLHDPKFAEVVDTFLNTSGLTNFRLTTDPQDILRDNVDLATAADVVTGNMKLDDILRRLDALQYPEPARADGVQPTLEDRIARIIRDEAASVREALKIPEKPADLAMREEEFKRTSEKISVAENGLALICTLVGISDPRSAQRLEKLSNAMIFAAKAQAAFRLSPGLGSGLAVTNAYLTASIVLVGLLGNSQGPDVDQLILDSLFSISKQIEAFRNEVRFRFDRLEDMLIPTLRDMQQELSKVSLSLSEIKNRVGAIQDQLVGLNDRIERMEQVLLDALLDTQQLRYSDEVLTCLGERTSVKMSFDAYSSCANTFVNWATNYAQERGKALAAQGAPGDLTTVASEGARLGNDGLSALVRNGTLPSLEPWLKGADAYVRLVSLHPEFSRGDGPERRNTLADLRDIISTGERLSAAMERIFFISRDSEGGLGRRGPAPRRENDLFVRAIHKEVRERYDSLVVALSKSMESLALREFRGYHPFNSGAPPLEEPTQLFRSEIVKTRLPQCEKRDVEFLPFVDFPADWDDVLPFGMKLSLVMKYASVVPCYRLTVSGLDHKFSGGIVGGRGRAVVAEEQAGPADAWDNLRTKRPGERTRGTGVKFVFEVLLDVSVNYPAHLNRNIPPASYRIVIPYELPLIWPCYALRMVGDPLSTVERGPSGFPVPDDRLQCATWAFTGGGYHFISIRQLANDLEFYNPLRYKVESGGGLRDQVSGPNWPRILKKQRARAPLVTRSPEGIVSEYPRFEFDNRPAIFAMKGALDGRLREFFIESTLTNVFSAKGDRHDSSEEFARSISLYRSFLSKGLASHVAQQASSTNDELPPGTAYLSVVMRQRALAKEQFAAMLSAAGTRLSQSADIRSARKDWKPDESADIDLSEDEGFRNVRREFDVWQQDLLRFLRSVSTEGDPSDLTDVALSATLGRLRQERDRQELERLDH